MRRRFQSGAVGLILFAGTAVLSWPVVPSAKAASTPSLEISKFKVATGSQFVEFYNSGSEPVSMSSVQLVYYNNFDLVKATSSKVISFTGELAPQSYFLVNDSNITACYQMMLASASLGFNTTTGMVQLIYFEQETLGGPFTSQVMDSVAWTRKDSEAVGNVILNPTNSNAFVQRTGGGWQELEADPNDPCGYVQILETPEYYEDFVFLGSSLPPVRYVAGVSASTGKINRNIGKMAPVVNELLPNPASPQTDADDEFIELYNPNDTTFDLSGFKLAFGSTKPRKYTIPEGTIMQPKEFKTFTSGDTSISLSNTEAQVWLLDPNEKIIGQSEPYGKAKDGQSWALDSNTGKWVWTSQPTPEQMNALTLQTADSKGKIAAATLGITSTPNSGGANSADGGSQPASLADATPLHPSILAMVGIGAVGYALYEYRHDIQNRIFQLRRYLRNRRTLRQEV